VIAVGVGIWGNLGSGLCGNSVHYGDGFAACFGALQKLPNWLWISRYPVYG